MSCLQGMSHSLQQQDAQLLWQFVQHMQALGWAIVTACHPWLTYSVLQQHGRHQHFVAVSHMQFWLRLPQQTLDWDWLKTDCGQHWACYCQACW